MLNNRNDISIKVSEDFCERRSSPQLIDLVIKLVQKCYSQAKNKVDKSRFSKQKSGEQVKYYLMAAMTETSKWEWSRNLLFTK